MNPVSRALLFARNTAGRAVGASWTYTPAQVAVAETIYATWMSFLGVSPMIAAGWVADADRELALTPSLVGDRGEAHGIAQWHTARRTSILKGTGIDVMTASVADQCRAANWEVTKGPYKRVMPLLLAAATDTEVNQILIADFEQSANHSRDLARQLPMARYWLGRLGPAAATS